jgi:hypothetical protein
MQGARRGALQAKFNSGMPLTALEYVEFGDIVPAGFSTRLHAGNAEQRAEREQRDRKVAAEFAENERKRLAAPHPMTQREAQDSLSAVDYNKWVDANQGMIARTSF